MGIAREGLREIAVATVVIGVPAGLATYGAAAATPWWAVAAAPLWAIWLLVIAFFRDPRRVIPAEPGALVSPADGTVTEVARLDRHDEIGGPAVRIGIFLSIFNVHVNRSPCSGRVVRTEYRPGEFLDARHPECGARNEANTILLDPEPPVFGPVIVRQIAGLIARRIVCHAAVDGRLDRGQRIGLIKFGSRTELIVPDRPELETAVRVGDRVRGGSSVLARVRERTREASVIVGASGAEASRRIEPPPGDKTPVHAAETDA